MGVSVPPNQPLSPRCWLAFTNRETIISVAHAAPPGGTHEMKKYATPADTTRKIETYARTNSDGHSELVFYTPSETHEWINADATAIVAPEDYR